MVGQKANWRQKKHTTELDTALKVCRNFAYAMFQSCRDFCQPFIDPIKQFWQKPDQARCKIEMFLLLCGSHVWDRWHCLPTYWFCTCSNCAYISFATITYIDLPTIFCNRLAICFLHRMDFTETMVPHFENSIAQVSTEMLATATKT